MKKVLLALAASTLLLTACGGGGGEDGDDAAAPAESGRATTTAEAGGEGSDGDAPSGGGAGEATTTTAAASAAEGSSASGGGATAGATPSGEAAARPEPAAPGRYEYDVEGTSTLNAGGQQQSRPVPDTATLTIDPPQGERQRSVRETKDADGNGSTNETVLIYAADGVHLESLKMTSSGQGVNRTYEFHPSPPPLLVPAGAPTGHHAEFTMKSTDGRLTVNVTVDLRGRETVTVADATIEALVLDIASTFSGDFEGEQTSREWIDPERSLTVREKGQLTAKLGVYEVTSQHEATIRRLTPQ